MKHQPLFVAELERAAGPEIPLKSRVVLYLIVLMVVSFIFWARLAELDEITRGIGKIVPSSKVQIVQHLEGGILTEMLVRQGDTVEAGQPLLRIDNKISQSNLGESRLKQEELLARQLRLRAEAGEGKLEIIAETASLPVALLESEQALLNSNMEYLKNQADIVEDQIAQRRSEVSEAEIRVSNAKKNREFLQKQMDMTKPMVERGIESESDYLRLEREMVSLNDTVETTRASISRISSAIRELQKKKEDLKISFQTRAQKELNEVNAQISQLGEKKTALADQVERTLVTSPARGIVKQMHINTINGVVRPGMDLIEIVPIEDSLLIEAKIQPSDIAFLHPGQKAVVKVTAYDFSIYGGLDGEVLDISADSLLEPNGAPYFLVRIKTLKNFLGSPEKMLKLIPGMQVSVDILTGKKTVMDYLLKPIFKARSAAMTER
ncbi:HlyD family type I secretion periplasmic adaptor subunit [Erysipelotrichia bacterium]